ncbi:MAG: hypothetical protein AAF557_15235 [Pseudomonadota bacterium]
MRSFSIGLEHGPINACAVGRLDRDGCDFDWGIKNIQFFMDPEDFAAGNFTRFAVYADGT